MTDSELHPFVESIAREARRPVVTDPAARERIMAAVRAEPVPVSRVRYLEPAGGASRRSGCLLRRSHCSRRASSASVFSSAISHLTGTASRRPGDPRSLLHRSSRFLTPWCDSCYVAPRATTVYVVGDFNGWDTTKTPLSRTSKDGVWSVTLPLSAGRHIYAYVVDGSWSADPACTARARRRVRPCQFRQARSRRILVVTHGSLQRNLRILARAGALLLLQRACLSSRRMPDPLAKLETKDKIRDRPDDRFGEHGWTAVESAPLMALQGIAKQRRRPNRSSQAVRKQLIFSGPRESVLGQVDDQELIAGCVGPQCRSKAGAARGVPAAQKGTKRSAGLRRLGRFSRARVPSDDAFSAITKLWQDGADDETFYSLWTNVQSDISQGLNPGTALQNRIREAPGRRFDQTVKPPEGAAGEPKLERI